MEKSAAVQQPPQQPPQGSLQPADGAPKKPAKPRGKSYAANPILDFVLTALFGAELLYCLYYFARDDLWLFAALVAASALLIQIVRAVSHRLATAISAALPWHPIRGPTAIRKFKEQSWQLFIHFWMTVAEVAILRRETWAVDTRTCWEPHPAEQVPDLHIRIFYLFQLGIWTYTCFSHRFIEPRRKDYFVMYAHHVTTIFLIALSFTSGFIRVGVLVLIVHDSSDVLVDFLKLGNYLRLEGRRGWYINEITFVLTVIVWIAARNVTFLRVIYSSFIESHMVLEKDPELRGKPWLSPAPGPGFFMCNFMLGVLYVMHIYWLILFLRIAYRILAKTELEKISEEEYEGEDEDHPHKE